MLSSSAFENRRSVKVNRNRLTIRASGGDSRANDGKLVTQDSPPIQRIGDPAGRSGPSVTQHTGDRGDGIPVARGGWDPKEPVKRAEVADDLHVSPVHAEDEPVVDREDLQQPLAALREGHRCR